ncbi:MAG: GRP family sugar transporter [Bacteroidales bacterium]|jgi:drug/metabolite transporter (DMT)-like permease|nr:GRP family sugar transporter [Bacteroidales bacterium]MDD3702452.1 GRP family sugar transporter [Bacteroidales bacterium]MDY0370363.1 GRP family sugar transporter [Bacteroidales bacterium]
MISFLFGTISALSFGISNAYWKVASKQIDFPYLVIFRGILASIFFGLCWIILKRFDLEHFGIIGNAATSTVYLQAIFICFVCSLGLIFFLSSLKFQEVSITVPITSVNIFNILTSVFIVGERFYSVYYLSFSIALVGILLTQNFKLNKKNRWNKGATYAILATFFWGITYPLFKFVSPIIGALPLSFILEFSVTISALIWAISKKKSIALQQLLSIKNLTHYFVLAGLLIGGTLFFNLAIQSLSVLTLNILSNLQLVVSVLIGIVVFKEKLSQKQLSGIILILISILLTQFFA